MLTEYKSFKKYISKFKALLIALILVGLILTTISFLNIEAKAALVIDQTKILPLINADFAQKTSNWINLIFFFKDNGIPIAKLKSEMNHAMGLDDVVFDPSRSYNADLGLFEIEPYKSNKNKFNVWYYDQFINDLEGRELSGLAGELRDKANFGLDYVAPIYAREEIASNENSLGSFANIQNAQNDPRRELISYDPQGMRLVYKKETSKDGSGNITTLNQIGLNNLNRVGELLVHEFGHSLFAFGDENNCIFGVSYVYPNCARSIDVAKEWWFDLEGKTIDPAYLEIFFEGYLKRTYKYVSGKYYKTVNTTNVEVDLAEERLVLMDKYRIGYVKGDCFGNAIDDVIRPNIGSIMYGGNDNWSYGPVNQRRITGILNSFSGNSAITSPTQKYQWVFNPKTLDPNKMETLVDKCFLEKSTNIYTCSWKMLTTLTLPEREE